MTPIATVRQLVAGRHVRKTSDLAIRNVAAGLVAAHEAGIVHRDLKPANIMVLPDHAVIMDFGIARSPFTFQSSADRNPRKVSAADSDRTPAVTVAGTVLGTLEYMAPEQANGQVVDQRADIYALGLMFADMLLGRRLTLDALPNQATFSPAASTP